MMAPLSYVHRFEPGEAPGAPTLLLLHGTGGDEKDLLPVGRMVAPGAPLLSPRGDVLERGMPRFFRRLAEGVFDEDDVRRRAAALADFVTDARKAYGIPAPVALGYSNGANIAAAVLLLRPHVLAGAILWRAMMPLTAPQLAPLSGTPVLMLSGARDPIAGPAEAGRLKAALEAADAAIEHRVLPVGHELSQGDVAIARQWLQQQFSEGARARPMDKQAS